MSELPTGHRSLRIGIVVNALADEQSIFTTTLLARAATRRGHVVAYLELTDVTIRPDGELMAWARCIDDPGPDAEDFLARLRATDRRRLPIEDLDALLLRSEPAFELESRPWAQPLGWQVGQLAAQRGVVVLSDPEALACAGPDKLYTLGFPAEFRPPTLITRDPAAVAEFVDAQADGAVVKPLHGGAGDSVFLVRRDEPNLDQIIAAVGRRGYLVVQPYLPAVAEGSIRLFLLDGEVLAVDGQIAALRLLPTGADIRTNFHVSHTVAPAALDEAALAAARAVGPRLAKDGMFLVGLDIVGGLVLEANLHAAGGLRGAERLTGADFSGAVLAAVETRVARV